MSDLIAPNAFVELGLVPALTDTLAELDYESPTPVQAQTIPALLSGQDVIGQAQTGSGKTAAFSLPILQRLKSDVKGVQALVMTPTRELALQVASAMESYAKRLGNVRIAAIYGGAPMDPQIRALHRGVHVVVGTPGRIIDHLERGTLSLASVHLAVLDEADQMLKMGFIEDVEHILSHIPENSQRALFSATMPDPIFRIAKKSLRNPVSIDIESSPENLPSIDQRVLRTTERDKLGVLTRLLESQTYDAAIIFTRTQARTAEIAEKLLSLGIAAEALHGGLNQAMRERVISRLRAGAVRIVVATDVAARGLDVEQISMVINYDIPFDVESYVHRIGRTGRAGREGVAYLLVNPPERRMLMSIERFIQRHLPIVELPGAGEVAQARQNAFRARIVEQLQSADIDFYAGVVSTWAEELEVDPARIAAAAIRIAVGEKSFVPPPPERPRRDAPVPRDVRPAFDGTRTPHPMRDTANRPAPERPRFEEPGDRTVAPPRPVERSSRRGMEAEAGMVRLFLSAGRQNGVRPQEVVAAIAGQAGITGRDIGYIEIQDRSTFVDVHQDVVAEVIDLQQIDLGNRRAVIRVARPADGSGDQRPSGPPFRPPMGGGPRTHQGGGARGGYNGPGRPQARRGR